METEKIRPSFTFIEDRLADLRAIVPEAFPDGTLNWDLLREALGEFADDVDAAAEHFGLNWPGKREARRLAAKPSHGTLVAARGEGVNEDTTRNLFIEGDNLEVLKLLQKSYAGRIKLIYIDPPYNTGNDFVYKDDYSEPLSAYLRRTSQAAETGELLTTNPKISGRFHSNWLNMIYPRLRLARALLRDDGAIFVSIDDNEVHNLRAVLNEVFGEESFIASFVWQKRYSRDNRPIVGAVHDYILLYAKDPARFAEVRNLLPPDEASTAVYRNPNNDPRGRWRPIPMTAQGTRPNQMYKIVTPTGKVHTPPLGRCWSTIEAEYLKLRAQGRIWFGTDGNGQPNVIRYLSEIEGFVPWTWWPHTEVGHTDEAKKEIHGFFGKDEAFDTPKPVRLLKRILQLGTKNDSSDIVLDFFAGSGTTAQATLEANRDDGGNRRFILVQIPEPTGYERFPTIADVCKERIRRTIANLDAERTLSKDTSPDLGFAVFKLTSSNLRRWNDYEGNDLQAVRSLFDEFQSPLVDHWTPETLLPEVLILEGFPLDSKIEPRPEFRANVVSVASSPACGHRLWTCFDETVRPETLDALELPAGDVFVCLDSALDDNAKLRLTQAGVLKTI